MISSAQKKTQDERVIEYIREFGSITQIQALADLGIMRLASRISDLKKQGYSIERKMVEGKNRYGEKVVFAEYTLGTAKEKKADEIAPSGGERGTDK